MSRIQHDNGKPMLFAMGRAVLSMVAALALSQPTLACVAGPPQMTPADIASAKVAFVGTVIAIEVINTRTDPRVEPSERCTGRAATLDELLALHIRAQELRDALMGETGSPPIEIDTVRRPTFESPPWTRQMARRAHYSCEHRQFAVFSVEEPVHGATVGTTFLAPQGEGSGDCATYFHQNQRYVFATTRENGQVWKVGPTTTFAEALANWPELIKY